MLRTHRIDRGGAGSLKMFKIEIWCRILPVVALLATFLLLLKTVKASGSLYERSRLIAYCLFQIDFKLSKQLNAISFIALFYLIYLMIFKSILSNNIKSNSIVMDTSEIVHTKQELLNTRKAICLAEGEFEYRMVREAPAGSYLRAVRETSKRNSQGQVCTLVQDPDNFLKQDLYNMLMLMNELNVFMAAYMMNALALDGKTFYYFGSKVFQVSSVDFFRLDIDTEFLELAILDFEFGFQEIIQDKVKSMLKTFEFKTPTFYLKQQYVDAFSDKQNTNLNLAFFSDTFALFAFAISLSIVLFVFHSLVRLVSNRNSIEDETSYYSYKKASRQLSIMK